MKEQLKQLLEERILVLDGAMGTMIQQKGLSAADFGGEEYEGCNEYLVLTRPDVIVDIHKSYIEAGADIIETNTFGATSLVLDEYNLGHLDMDINMEAAKLAKQAVKECNRADIFVAGAIGPTTKSLSVTGGTTFEALTHNYYRQALGLLKGGVDLLLVETSQDLLNVKAAGIGIQQAFEQAEITVPIMISGTIEPMGTTLAGQTIEAFYLSVEHFNPISVGLNCATGPEFMRDHIRSLADLSETYISCYPNAGLPDEDGHYHESPKSLATKMQAFAKEGWVNIVGGCCGTTPAHIKALKEAVATCNPHKLTKRVGHGVSGLDSLLYTEDMRPLFVGERTNVIGSRKFKELIKAEKYDEAAEIARGQVKKNAHVIDVCMADPDRDEQKDMSLFLDQLTRKIKVPIMIDSTDEHVIEESLKQIQGKGIINSINLEEGEARFEKVVPIAKKFGAALVVGTIDEDGMGVTVAHKLRVAKRSYQLLTEKYGIRGDDLIFDPLVFPVGTGDEQYIGSAAATIEGIRVIKQTFPNALTILGVSNISFGLPPLGREVLNAVFLYHATKAGLDYAIVNTEKLERYASISEEERKLSENLLFYTSDETLERFTNFYRGKKRVEKEKNIALSLDERLAMYIIEGSKTGLHDDLQAALDEGRRPLDIINGPLMTGMDEVGRLFNNNELIVAEVLQSAEAMKAAVSYLEPFMEKRDDAKKGKVILATVKGDVHDIGKNLVDIIFSNNGFEVINLGINVRSDALIESIRKHNPDIIGLSGLLVKSAHQMVVTVEDFKEANITTPVLVGGAALTRKFTETRILPAYGEGTAIYAGDAMNGLDLANKLVSPIDKPKLIDKIRQRPIEEVKPPIVTPKKTIDRPVKKLQKADVYMPQSLNRIMLGNINISQVAPFINRRMLFSHHLGFKGNFDKKLQEKDEKAITLNEIVNELVAHADDYIKPKAIYQFFPAQSKGDTIYIYHPENKKEIIETFTFPRQQHGQQLCLADYLRPVGDEMDYVAFLSVTAGGNVREIAEQWKQEGDYLRCHALQSLALETAEGLAEMVHMLIRDKWGFSDPVTMSMTDRFKAKYQGIRVSFGYPACPNLEDQQKLFKLLRPEEIGVQLTEGFMMNPEASVTAMVFAHPEAKYFSVTEKE
ncbi:MAG: methionine synthase [Bacillaceae bacterium]